MYVDVRPMFAKASWASHECVTNINACRWFCYWDCLWLGHKVVADSAQGQRGQGPSRNGPYCSHGISCVLLSQCPRSALVALPFLHYLPSCDYPALAHAQGSPSCPALLDLLCPHLTTLPLLHMPCLRSSPLPINVCLPFKLLRMSIYTYCTALLTCTTSACVDMQLLLRTHGAMCYFCSPCDG